MISFIAAHWWTWPLVYAGIGALLGGFFDGLDKVEDCIAWLSLWPLILLAGIGTFLRNMW